MIIPNFSSEFVDFKVSGEQRFFTAIYDVSFSASVSLVKMRRIERKNGETVEDMLKRENISEITLFLFHGHPLLQGEEVSVVDAKTEGCCK